MNVSPVVILLCFTIVKIANVTDAQHAMNSGTNTLKEGFIKQRYYNSEQT